MIQYKHILITLALLLTAATGAWAQEESLLTTVTATGHTTYSQSPEGMVTVTLNKIDSYHYAYGWIGGGSVTVEAAQGYTITRCVFKQNPNNFPDRVLVDDLAPFTATMLTNPDGGIDVSAATSHGDAIGDDFMNGISYIEVYGTAEPPIEVTPVAGKTNEWTFKMSGSDVELTPVYAPVAAFAVVSEVEQKPTAIEGIIAGEAKDIVKAGTVATTKIGEADPIAQGTVMYAVTTENKKPTSTEGFSATVPTGAVLTGSYAEDQTVYVWYYIKGIDAAEGVTPTAENTFNDSEICTTPLTVTLKANQFTLNIKQSPNITVTVAGTAKTPTDDKVTPVTTGQEVKIKAKEGYKFRKVEVKKGGAAAGKTITIGDMELTYADGDTWETIVSKNSDKIKTLSGRYIVQVAQPAPDTYTYIHVWYTAVKPSDIIDPSKNYQWSTLEVAY